MFENSLNDVLTTADEANILFRRLIRSIQDQGGSTSHLNRLLADAKGSHAIIDALAREAIGSIWKLAAMTINLGPIDFACSQVEFLRQYPGVSVANGALPTYDQGWSEPNRPKKKLDCGYTLIHSQTPQLIASVLNWGMGMNREHAGWRELVVYAAAVKTLGFTEISGCEILTAGSRLTFRKEVFHTFPRLGGEPLEVSWHGVKRPKEDRFWNTCFYLVRSYSKPTN